MEAIQERIKRADLQELDTLVGAIEERYRVLAPDWEVVYLALPKKDLKARKNNIELAMNILSRE